MQIQTGFALCPFQNTPPCGDHWLALRQGTNQRLMLADGIGHGATAHSVVLTLAEHLASVCRADDAWPDVEECLQELHQLLHRQSADAQAAVALVDVNNEDRSLKVAIIGNIEVHYFTPDSAIRFPSMHGMVGGRFPRQLHSTHAPISAASLLALFSDGLDSGAACDYLSTLQQRSSLHGLEIQAEAESMLSRFGRTSDDASCALMWIEEEDR